MTIEKTAGGVRKTVPAVFDITDFADILTRE